MATFSGLSVDSGISDVLNRFPRHSERLVQLLNDIMCDTGALSRGQREAIAAFTSALNTTPYCVFYHTLFSETFSGAMEGTHEQIRPLLDYARSLHGKQRDEILRAFSACLEAGWSEDAIYEVVEVCGIFNLINTIVSAADLATPEGKPNPMPTADDLRNSYLTMLKSPVSK